MSYFACQVGPIVSYWFHFCALQELFDALALKVSSNPELFTAEDFARICYAFYKVSRTLFCLGFFGCTLSVADSFVLSVAVIGAVVLIMHKQSSAFSISKLFSKRGERRELETL
jgi:hypothetical protein